MLSPVQFGNRKGWTALDALLLKVVTMDCLHLFRLNGTILNNDATACYDQMILKISSLHVQSLGLPDNATKCSVLLNHNMKHYVKTNTGITKEFYKHEPTNKKFGKGQGKTSSLSNWLFQSSTLLNALHYLCVGIYLFGVCQKFVEKRVAEAYVDDADCTYVDQSNQENETLTRIWNRLKKIAQVWENLIHGSGGELSHDKTYWWLIWWVWENGVSRMATKQDVDIDLAIRFGNDMTETILKRKEPNESIAQLGVKNNLTSDFTNDVNDRIKTNKAVTTCLKHASLSPKNAFRLYQNIWLPKMQYPLA
eukprot:10778624-Ditylum_brightwellii.AAC.1